MLLTWFTTLVLDHADGLPPTVSFVLVVVAWALIVSIAASVVASVARTALYGTESRLERRYRSLFTREQGVVSNDGAHALADRAVREASALDRTVAVLDVFGGHTVFFPHSINPFQVLRPGALGLGLVVSIWSWPALSSWRPVDVWERWVRFVPDWDDLRGALPIAIVLVGLVVVGSRTPLLDRIRARDEAAKDANRLLARWSYAAAELASIARERGRDVHRLSSVIVDGRCAALVPTLSYSMGTLSDSRDGDGFRGRAVPIATELADTTALSSAMEQAETLNEEIRRQGLRYVAWNLIPSVTPFIHRAGVDWLTSTPALRHHWYLDGTGLTSIIEGRLSTWDRDGYERARSGPPSSAERAIVDLEASAVGLDLQLSVSAVQLQYRAGCLVVAHDRISRRLLGSPWTKLLSVAKS